MLAGASLLARGSVGRFLLHGALVAIIATTLGSCGVPKDDNIAKAIGIQEFAFNPDPYRAQSGDTVQVVNLDSVTHTLTADDGSLDTGRVKSRGDATITVDRAGVIAYHCEIHDFMRGVIQVAEQSGTS
jgi:plastocyanin